MFKIYSHQEKRSLFFVLTLFLLIGCSQGSDQREFEQDAFREAEGFTETDSRGEIIREDPDDWRIAPFFQGLVEIDPAYPNPVQSNNQISLDLIITGVESVSGLRIFAYYGANNIRQIYEDPRRPLSTGLTSIPLNPLDIARLSESPQGLYRIIVLDANENVITYGDIRVE